jgi:hypothetical protein
MQLPKPALMFDTRPPERDPTTARIVAVLAHSPKSAVWRDISSIWVVHRFWGAYACQVTEWRRDHLIGALLVAPAGAALLARLEAEQRSTSARPCPWWESPDDVDVDSVDLAAASLAARSIGDLLAAAVSAAEDLAGPWRSGAPGYTAAALRNAPARAKIAAAVVDRLGERLEAPLDPSAQEWWWSNDRFSAAAPLMGPLGGPRKPCSAWVTATWDGLWTVTTPEPELADPLVSVWEISPGPVSRWRLRVEPTARVFEVNQPTDWEHLVTTYPLAEQRWPSWSWELPGIHQYPDLAALAALDGQRAMRTRMNRFVEPDWDTVADDWDAVHLTWAGFLTTEGLIIDLGDDDIAMLRGWNSERTLWLNPVLSDPHPGSVPALSGAINSEFGVDAATDPDRRAQDLEWLTYRLGI